MVYILSIGEYSEETVSFENYLKNEN